MELPMSISPFKNKRHDQNFEIANDKLNITNNNESNSADIPQINGIIYDSLFNTVCYIYI